MSIDYILSASYLFFPMYLYICIFPFIVTIVIITFTLYKGYYVKAFVTVKFFIPRLNLMKNCTASFYDPLSSHEWKRKF